MARLALETRLVRLAVETKLARLAVETKLARLAVETKLARLCVLTIGPKIIVDIYPAVPSPITVEPNCV